MPHRALTHATATPQSASAATALDGDLTRLKKQRRNERDRQRSLLKRESLHDMRKLVEELEATKRKLLAGQQQHAPAASHHHYHHDLSPTASVHALALFDDAPHSSSAEPAIAPLVHVRPRGGDSLSPSKAVGREDFVRLTELIERLRVENAALARDLRERDLFNSAMQHLLLDFDRSETAAAAPTGDSGDNSSTHDSDATSERIGFAPLTADEVRAFAHRTLRQCRTARLEHEASRAAAAGSVFGWSDFRVRSGATITFAVRKPLVRTQPAQLRDTIWDLATDGARIARLLPAGITCDLRVLQRVSPNVLVIDRRTHTGSSVGGSGGLALRTVFMVFRTREPDGAELLVMKTLDSPLAKKLLLPGELWCDIFYWMRFEAARGGSDGSGGSSAPSDMTTTVAEFGGVLTYVREDLAVSWLAELLFLAVRWETIAVRPVLLKWS